MGKINQVLSRKQFETVIYAFVTTFIPTCSLMSADQLLLWVPKIRHNLRTNQAFAVATPKMWNDPLKTHLFSLAFDTMRDVDVILSYSALLCHMYCFLVMHKFFVQLFGTVYLLSTYSKQQSW